MVVVVTSCSSSFVAAFRRRIGGVEKAWLEEKERGRIYDFMSGDMRSRWCLSHCRVFGLNKMNVVVVPVWGAEVEILNFGSQVRCLFGKGDRIGSLFE